MNYWLMKTEPDTFGLEDLKSRPRQTEPWDGVRNYQARNFMRQMKLGDQIAFYHSNCKVPGIVGIAEVASEPYPDPTQFDPESKYHDPKSDPGDPRWSLVDVRFVRELKRCISLSEIKSYAEQLDGLPLIRRGNRLSVMPIEAKHWKFLMKLEKQ